MNKVHLKLSNNNLPQIDTKMRTYGGNSITTARTEGDYVPNEFADAVYSNGPYSLMHPNVTTDIVAQNVDLLG